jgi:indolepyruvate ferredoxin oxidoreductase
MQPAPDGALRGYESVSDPEPITLDDKYRLDGDRALIGGRQALVRLPLMQRAIDRRAGLNTAGLISGYRGSPLGGYDMELWKAAEHLKADNIIFQPGLNEDLAMTALAGSQQLDFLPGRKFDGVFGIWYGKGPGVDRSGDAIKHANLNGVSPAGGLVLAFGDDHTGKSSTTAHQSDLTLATWGVPILYPSSVSEILEMGLAAIAMSRFSGLVVGLKLVNETAEGTGVVALNGLPDFVMPPMAAPEGGVHIRQELRAMQEQDLRLVRHKLPRAEAFARANGLDRLAFGAASPRFVVATAGKAYADVLAALEALGVTDAVAQRLGLGVYKLGMIFPLDPVGLFAVTAQAEEIFFVEEKRPHIETQAKALLYNRPVRPRISGKTSPDGEPLLPPDLALDAGIVAAALAERLQASFQNLSALAPGFAEESDRARALLAKPKPAGPMVARRPAFCPGCPHNTSTKVPEGSFGATGIGCHGMVMFHPERNPVPMGHMGAEGANWIGLAPFTETPHIFQNLGDGTYSHSGSLAIRAAVQAGVNITYKILLNDAVAMTGGQPVEGSLTADRVAHQVRAEGVARIALVSEQPEHFAASGALWAAHQVRAEGGRIALVPEQPERFAVPSLLPVGTELRHRDELGVVQEAFRTVPGVSVIIYDQTCAAEKRRRRKINAYPDPDRRIFINEAVCEGCGDCSVQSNCLAIQPLETELGRKRRIDQSTCNKDFSCVKGFCPSFVTVEGGKPRRAVATDLQADGDLPLPVLPALGDGFDLVIAGVGGTGVVTVSAILGMAARIEGLGVSLYDMTGLSQKGGQVFSHVRLRAVANAVVPARIGPAEANLVLACDLIAAVQGEALDTIRAGRTMVVANSDMAATADFQVRRDLVIPESALISRLASAAGSVPLLLPAATLSQDLLGDSIGANILMLGYAWQQGAIPLSLASIEQAIELNGKAAKANLKAFTAGRMACGAGPKAPAEPLTLDAFVTRRRADLETYWNSAYAQRYDELIARVRDAASALQGGDALVWAVARAAHKLMAYKDEYEVARLYTDGRFRAAIAREFEDVRTLRIHLSPPILARLDPRTGRPAKMTFGAWILPVFGMLARMRGLREGPLDLFGRSAERRLERDLRDTYVAAIASLTDRLSQDNLEDTVALAAAPLDVRGFGPVKTSSAEALLRRLREVGRD